MTSNRFALPFSRHGFTMIELAIVLVILGLIAGGVLGAQELLKNSQLRSLGAELTRYESAVVTFRDKYQAMPGDFTGATAIWGSAGGNGSDVACMHSATSGFATCNGNGNGLIDDSVAVLDESFRAWQHLGNAQLLDANFIGTSAGVAVGDFIGKVVPDSRMDGVGAQFTFADKVALGWLATSIPDGGTPLPALIVGAPVAATPVQIGANAISPYDAGSLDEKLDDGKPGLGKIFVSAASYASFQCITGNDATVAQYIMTNEDPKNCMMYFKYVER